MLPVERIEEIRDYCLCDVIQTTGVFLRVQLLRGELSRERYLTAMNGLIALIREDKRVAAVSEALNTRRLLLEEELTTSNENL